MASYANDFSESTLTYFKELKSKRYAPISKEEEAELIKRAKDGDENARTRIIETNLRFVFDTAKRLTGHGLSISELISEGNVGLMKALDKFDAERDVKFISYAVWWVKDSMFTAIEKYKKQSIRTDFIEEKPLEPLHGVKDKEDEDTLTYIETSNGYEDQTEVKEFNTELVKKLLGLITDKEREVLIKYFGLGDDNEKTLIEIGKEMSITSERVRQIKMDAIKKLRTKSLVLEEAEHYV